MEDTTLKDYFSNISWLETKMQGENFNFGYGNEALFVNERGHIKSTTLEEKDWDRFKARLAANDLTYIDVGGEGDCLFHCLAAIFYNNKKEQQRVR